MIMQEIRVTKDYSGKRADIILSAVTRLSRSAIQQLISDGYVKVNNSPVKPSYKLREGDVMQVVFPGKKEHSLLPEALSVEVLYRDNYLMVLNKPPGMVMYPAPGHSGGTLMNAVAYLSCNLASAGAPLRPGVVHRIDKETSGLVVVALNDETYHGLVKQFKERSIKRLYNALIYGEMKREMGEVALPIGRSTHHRKKMSTRSRRGKPAKTSWKIIERYKTATLIEAQLATGRTHQIRVHFSALGHPVLGDKTYGRKHSIMADNHKVKIHRQMLHAESIGFAHPQSGEWLEFHTPPPEDMREIMKVLRESS